MRTRSLASECSECAWKRIGGRGTQGAGSKTRLALGYYMSSLWDFSVRCAETLWRWFSLLTALIGRRRMWTFGSWQIGVCQSDRRGCKRRVFWLLSLSLGLRMQAPHVSDTIFTDS